MEKRYKRYNRYNNTSDAALNTCAIGEFAAKRHKRNSLYQIWTHENHAIELISTHFIDQKLNYIHDNPVRAGYVFNAGDYIYSSARNYVDMNYILEVDLL